MIGEAEIGFYYSCDMFLLIFSLFLFDFFGLPVSCPYDLNYLFFLISYLYCLLPICPPIFVFCTIDATPSIRA